MNLHVKTSGLSRVVAGSLVDENASPSCALDIAEEGGLRLEEVGNILGVTRERVRQIQDRAILKLAIAHPELLRDWKED